MRLTVRMKDPRYDSRHRYASSCYIPEYNDYTGDIVPRYTWLDDNWFCLREEDGTTRILHKDGIICGWMHSGRDNSNPERLYVSIPRGNKSYTVSLGSDNRLHCDCTGYGYRRTCSHVAEVMEAA